MRIRSERKLVMELQPACLGVVALFTWKSSIRIPSSDLETNDVPTVLESIEAELQRRDARSVRQDEQSLYVRFPLFRLGSGVMGRASVRVEPRGDGIEVSYRYDLSLLLVVTTAGIAVWVILGARDLGWEAVAKHFGALWLVVLPLSVLWSLLRLRGILRRGCLGDRWFP